MFYFGCLGAVDRDRLHAWFYAVSGQQTAKHSYLGHGCQLHSDGYTATTIIGRLFWHHWASRLGTHRLLLLRHIHDGATSLRADCGCIRVKSHPPRHFHCTISRPQYTTYTWSQVFYIFFLSSGFKFDWVNIESRKESRSHNLTKLK